MAFSEGCHSASIISSSWKGRIHSRSWLGWAGWRWRLSIEFRTDEEGFHTLRSLGKRSGLTGGITGAKSSRGTGGSWKVLEKSSLEGRDAGSSVANIDFMERRFGRGGASCACCGKMEKVGDLAFGASSFENVENVGDFINGSCFENVESVGDFA